MPQCLVYTDVHQIHNSLLLHTAESALKVALPGLVRWLRVRKGTCVDSTSRICVSQPAFCGCDKHHNEKQLVEEEGLFQFTDHNPPLKEAGAGT